MSILKGNALESFIRAPSPDVKAVLVYGPDAGRVRETAAIIVRSNVGSLDDPFTVVKLTDDQLAADPALLADEARSLSFTGGRRVVWVGQAGRGFQHACESYLPQSGGEALIVAEAGALPKSSKLRTMFERAQVATIIACYEDTTEELRTLARRSAAMADLYFEEGALELLVDRVGSDRTLSRSEIDKLLLYCHGRASIEIADIEAVCGDVSASSLDELVDATFEGDAALACRRLSQLIESGTSPSAILAVVGAHLARLQEFRLDVDHGKSRDAVLKAARPPLMFRRQPRVHRQLAAWDGAALDGAMQTVLESTALTRDLPALDCAIAERALLALIRKSRALRAKSV